MNNIELGDLGERAAADYLTAKGYHILAQKYRNKLGEIDIIAKYQNDIIFVEVKTRRSVAYGFPAEAVTYRKQQKILKTALCYLMQMKDNNSACRFDVMEVFISSGGNIQYNHIINAFGE